MRRNSLLESLSKRVDSQDVHTRRYSLSELISESYKIFYDCDNDSNMRKLSEAHLNDVRSHPADIDRLSRQLSNLKHLKSMVESKSVKDEELLVPKEKYDTVEPKKSKLDEAASPVYVWDSEFHKEYMVPCRIKLYQKDGSNIFGTVYEPDGKEFTDYGADIYDNDKAEMLAGTGMDIEGFETEEEAKAWVEAWFSTNLEECADAPRKAFSRAIVSESKDDEDVVAQEDEDLLEDTDLTDEEVEELTKHLAEIRKTKKVAECNANKPVTESTKGRKMMKRNIKISTSSSVNESKSWDKISLTEFSKKSASKAFVKTFKKLDKYLHEGTALTRQDSIALYKAANSAMTHLSVELEHNPEFLETYKESVDLLSADVDKLLEGLKSSKAPSKATMKSLAKFSEALLLEDEEESEDIPAIEDEESVEVDPEEDTPEEENEISAEAEELLQDYADAYVEAREEIHDELEEKYGESEDPAVQEILEQDAEEVEALKEENGEEESAAEETTEEEAESEESPEEESDVVVETPDDDITDDELAELKKHLMEMRKAKQSK